MKSDVVVMGGGVAGLAAGALLARAGKSVTVLEKGNQAGGRAYTYADKGFTLNYGPHAIYLPTEGILAGLIDRLGCQPLQYGGPEPAKSYWSDDGRFGAIGSSPTSLLTTNLFPVTSRVQLTKLMLAFRGAKIDRIDDGMTYGEWIDAHVSDPRVRRFARAFGTVNTYSRPSRDLSAKFFVRHVQRTLFSKDGVGYMSGGWASMYNTFLRALTENGGHLVTGARIDTLRVEDGRVIAATAGSEHYEADAFVCALPPQDAATIAPAGSTLAASLARWERLDDVRGVCIDLGLSRRVRTESTFVFDVERDLYYSLHSEVTPDLAPEGGQLLHAMAYLSPDEAASDTMAAARRDELIAGLDRWFAGWREAIVVERVLPNVRVTPLRHTPAQTGGNALPLQLPGAENLYFTGDARDLPYNLADISLASAIEAAEAVAARAAVTSRQPVAV